MQRLRAIRPATAAALFLSLLGGRAAVAERAVAPARPTPAPTTAPTSAAAAPSTSASAAASPPPGVAASAKVDAPVAPQPPSSAGPKDVEAPASDPDAPPPPKVTPRAYGSPGEGADIPVQATRRRGLLVGIVGGLDLGSARGTPTEFSKRDDSFRVDTGITPGYAGTVFLGGALTDWFSFSLGFGKHSMKSGDLTASATTFLFRVETYPLFWRGGAFRDLGLGLDLGTGSSRVDRGNELRAAAGGGSTSIFGGSVFYELLRLRTFTVAPYVGYHHIIGETLTTDTATLGARIAFTTGP